MNAKKKAMTVKEVIDKLSALPDSAEVFYITADGGLHDVSKVMHALPEDAELIEITGKDFVIIE